MYDDVGNTEGDSAESSNQTWSPRNHRKLNEQDLKNLHPHLRSKYLAVRRHMRRA